MALTKIDTLPPPPLPEDNEVDFNNKAAASLAGQQKMVTQVNQLIDDLNPLLPQVSSISDNAAKAQSAAKAAQDAQAATEAAAGNPIRLGLLQAIALCF